jgi:deoxyribodipyrimidine photo-lyase
VAAVLNQHSLAASEKYVQEVLWRTYWKGWLEMRPSVWTRFVEERDRQRESFSNKRALEAAEGGTTGIDAFDHYARELVTTGYIHNHARMWFASIWIFTLRLPWTLGSDFFLRHLLDADAASNTLSWRWVAGLQTVGKTYHATAHNIARYTNGRFSPVGLASEAVALTEPPIASAQTLPLLAAPDAGEPSLLLVTHEDMHPETFLSELRSDIPIVAALVATDDDLLWGDRARAFVKFAAADTASRIAADCNFPAKVSDRLDTALLLSAARAAGVRQIFTAYTPVGPVADALATITPALKREGVALTQIRRPWDEQFWPQAKKGFFTFKEQIPSLLRAQGLL